MSIIIMILLLSLLILVHEAGHFFAARAFGIKVDKFGFGLPVGPTLYKTKVGDVEVLVHAFLLGGYVSFPDDEKDCELPKDSPERFANSDCCFCRRNCKRNLCDCSGYACGNCFSQTSFWKL